jgi:prepilin-type N-terminal cleavage/methylation domain-containing protein
MFKDKEVKNKKIGESLGFTLIEVLIAMAIFSIGILAVGSMQLAATRGSSSARLSSEAVAVAQSRAETLIILPYAHAALNVGTSAPITVGNYTVIWTVWDDVTATPWGVTPAANTKVVQVAATSLRGGLGRRTATLTFVRGLNL